MRNLIVVLLVAIASGCGMGSAKVSGDVEGRTFDFKTVYGWIDAKEYEGEGAKAVLKDREHKTLYLRFSGASFDPEQDQNFVTIDEVLQWIHDEDVNGSMSLEIHNGDKAVSGTTVVYPPPAEPQEDSIYIERRRYNYAKTEVEGDAELRQEIPLVGSRQTTTVTFDEVGAEAGDVVSGTVEFKIEKEERDPEGVKTGTITIEFSAPLINEWIAETNGSRFDL